MKIALRKTRWVGNALSNYHFRRFRKKHTTYPPFPEHLDIEVTNACNLRCIMCPREKMDRKVEHMRLNVFEKICDELIGAKEHVKKVSLHLYGEPILHPAVFDMVSALKRGGIRWVEFSTNGTVLDMCASEKLISSGLDLVILAIDGTSEETYARIRRGGQYEGVVENIKSFLRLRDETASRHPSVKFQIIAMTETQTEISRFKRQWNRFLRPGDGFYVKKLAFNEFNKGLVCDAREGVRYRVPCELSPYRNLTIYADGRVTICCYDLNGELVVGDVRDSTLVDLWNSRTVKEYFLNHHNGNFFGMPLCDRCEWTTRHCEFEPVRALKFILAKVLGGET